MKAPSPTAGPASGSPSPGYARRMYESMAGRNASPKLSPDWAINVLLSCHTWSASPRSWRTCNNAYSSYCYNCYIYNNTHNWYNFNNASNRYNMHNLVGLVFSFESHILENIVDQMNDILVTRVLFNMKTFFAISPMAECLNKINTGSQAGGWSEWKTEATLLTYRLWHRAVWFEPFV